MKHHLRFNPTGKIDCLYTEAIDLRELGMLSVLRASSIEFNEVTQLWEVKAAGDGMFLHSDPSREACLAWERRNLGPN